MINLSDLVFSWHNKNSSNQADDLGKIDKLHIKEGMHTYLYGPSGSGKSTVLHLLSGILKPKSGKIVISGTDITKLSNSESDQFRAQHISIIFQQFNLIPYLNIVENVQMGTFFIKNNKEFKSSKADAIKLLKELGMDNTTFGKLPSQISTGQQQRVAVARALHAPGRLILADEPTSALDQKSKHQFLQLMFKTLESRSATLVFVSHDPSIYKYFDNKIDCVDLWSEV